jgi:transposase InsO family protein
MSRKGNCWDNAVVESLNGNFKVECINRQNYASKHQAMQDALEYIRYYNHDRSHSKLGYLSPIDYEKRWFEAQKTANQTIHQHKPL